MSARPYRVDCETCQECIPTIGRTCSDCTAAAAKSRGEPVISCVRFYPNGHSKAEYRVPADLQTWIEYNCRFRPGTSLFVEGQCRNNGAGFTKSDCEEIERCLVSGRPWRPSDPGPSSVIEAP